jgi:hypothetical protein
VIEIAGGNRHGPDIGSPVALLKTTAGIEVVTKKGWELELAAPVAVFDTVTDAVPCVATSELRIEACNCLLLTNVVARALTFQFTTEVLVKPAPFTVRLKAA